MMHTFKTIDEIESTLNRLEREMTDEDSLQKLELENEIKRHASFFTPIFVGILFTTALLLINHFRG